MISKYYDDNGNTVPYDEVEKEMLKCREEVCAERIKKLSQKIDDEITKRMLIALASGECCYLGVNNV